MSFVWEVLSQEQTEDYYEIRRSFRPSGRYRGSPGIEQFTINKVNGDVEIRQILDEPDSEDLPLAQEVDIGVVDQTDLPEDGPSESAEQDVQEPVQDQEVAEDEELPRDQEPIRDQEPVVEILPEPEESLAAEQSPVDAIPVEEESESAAVSEPEPQSAPTTLPNWEPAQVLEPTLISESQTSQPQTQTIGRRFSPTVIGMSAVGAVVAIMIGLFASGTLPPGPGPTPTIPPVPAQRESTAAPAGGAVATIVPDEFNPADQLTVVMVPPSAATFLPWELSLESLVSMRPALESLIDLDRHTGEYIPMLADAWEISEDRTTWTFFLKSGIQHHYGWGEFTATDVFHSIDMLVRQEAVSGGSQFWNENLRSMEVLGEYIIQIELFRPVSDFLSRVSVEHNLVMLSSAQWNEDGEEGIRANGPVGTGSYSIETGEPGVFISFSRVEDHWRKTPSFQQLQIFFVEGEATRIAAILSGEADIAQLFVLG